MTFVAASHGKSFVVVFCWAWPRLSCCFAALETKRKSGWGICGSSWVVLLWLCLMICLFHRYRPIVLSTAFFTAYVVIRTVPQSINGQTRGKKKVHLCFTLCFIGIIAIVVWSTPCQIWGVCSSLFMSLRFHCGTKGFALCGVPPSHHFGASWHCPALLH